MNMVHISAYDNSNVCIYDHNRMQSAVVSTNHQSYRIATTRLPLNNQYRFKFDIHKDNKALHYFSRLKLVF